MIKDNLQKKAKKESFDSIEDFIKANLNYLTEDKQRLFYNIEEFGKSCYKKKVSKKIYNEEVCYNGKS